MVTDIHIGSIAHANNNHQSFSSAHSQQSVSEHQYQTDEHPSHTGICSYDHGGHMGKTLAAAVLISENYAPNKLIKFSYPDNSWHSRNTIPKLRPPIG